MVLSAVQVAKRALVVLVRALAVAYGLTVNVNRDSSEKEVTAACRRVALRVHPDRGGSSRDQQRLNDARAAWEEARRQPKVRTITDCFAKCPWNRQACVFPRPVRARFVEMYAF